MFRPHLKNHRDPKKHKLRLRRTHPNFVGLVERTVGLISIESGYVFPSHLNWLRLILTKKMRRLGKYWIPVFPQQTLTKKPDGTRMGKGRGAVSSWVCRIRRRNCLVSISGLSPNDSISFLRQISKQLPIRCVIVTREKDISVRRTLLIPQLSQL